LIILKNIVLIFAASALLTACLGGSIAQQITRSIATSVADNALATAMDVQEIETENQFGRKPKSIILKDTVPDPYLIAFGNARFEQVKPIAEPLPEQIAEIETLCSILKLFLLRQRGRRDSTSGVNFINILCEAFTRTDPQSVKRYLDNLTKFLRFGTRKSYS
jgi:hypothetical protein